MVKKTKTTDNEDEIKKQLEHLKAQLKQQTKKGKPKKATKEEKGKQTERKGKKGKWIPRCGSPPACLAGWLAGRNS